MRIAIVGAGPTGLLLANHLLQNVASPKIAYDIDIFEKHPDPTITTASQGQDIHQQPVHPVLLQSRGMSALEEIPGLLDSTSAESTAPNTGLLSQGRWVDEYVFHMQGKADGATKTQKIRKPQKSFVISQFDLIKTMMGFMRHSQEERGTGSSPHSLNLHFETGVERVFLHNQTILTRREEDGKVEFSKFDYIVAADGLNSNVRKEVAAQDSSFREEKKHVPGGYRPFLVPKKEADNFPLLGDNVISGFMAGSKSVMLAPSSTLVLSDYRSGVLGFTEDKDRSLIDRLSTTQDVQEFVKEKMPVLKDLFHENSGAAKSLLEMPSHDLATLQCNQLICGHHQHAQGPNLEYHPSVLLMGDAAHTFSAAMNQGLNSALEDVKVFAKCLKNAEESCDSEEGSSIWQQALLEYNSTRLEDILAAHELSDYSLPNTAFQRVEFIAHAVALQLLPSELAMRILPPLPSDLIHRHDLTYRDVLSRCKGWINKVKASHMKYKGSEDSLEVRNPGEQKRLLLKWQI